MQQQSAHETRARDESVTVCLVETQVLQHHLTNDPNELDDAPALQGPLDSERTTQDKTETSSALQGLHGLEAHLQNTGRYIVGLDIEEDDPARKSAIRRGAKRLLLRNAKLFRRTTQGLRAISPTTDRVGLLMTFHAEVGQWDLETTKQFVCSRFW